MDENNNLNDFREESGVTNASVNEADTVQTIVTNNNDNNANLNNTDKKKKKDKKKWLIVLLILLLIASLSVSVWAVFFRDKSKAAPPEPPKTDGSGIMEPDSAPKDKEENAESMGDEGDKKLDQPEGGGAVSITYSKDVTIDLSDKSVSLLFGNPTRSNQDMVVQIVIQDNIVVQSDTLSPGYQVKKLALDDGSRLKAGTYNGKFKILYFDATSGQKAVVNTEIPVEINVQE